MGAVCSLPRGGNAEAGRWGWGPVGQDRIWLRFSLQVLQSAHHSQLFHTLPPVWGLPRGDEWLEATLLSTMPPVQFLRSWGLPSRETMTCGVGAELPSGPGDHNQQGCTMKPLGWSLGFPLCGTPLFPLLCVCTLSPSAQSVPLLEATPQSLPLAALCSSPSPGWPSGSQPHSVE